VVIEPDVVGFASRPQHTPLAVTSALPSEDMLPPPLAEVAVILVIVDVDKVGNSSFLHECKMTARRRKTKNLIKFFIGAIATLGQVAFSLEIIKFTKE
jgi:hypothetical protein